MATDVRRYLEEHPPHCEYFEHWEIQGKLRIHLSLAEELPPASASSSIMAIVLNSDRQVLYLIPTDLKGGIANLIPGGRPDPEETPEETIMREVAEETGWRVQPIKMIGFRHFFHLEPRSPRTDRPYPDFIQPIYVAMEESFDPRAIISGDRIPAEFMDYAEVEKRIVESQRPLLRAARDAVDSFRKTVLIGGIEKRDIRMVDYNPLWPEKYGKHAKIIRKALRDKILLLEHVGSTSVPGLAAKPIIDIDVVVKDSRDESSYLPALEAAGYVLRVREPDWHEHRMFRTPELDVHVHVFSPGSPEVERHLIFRDRLIKFDEDRQAYESVKQKLANEDWDDMNAYARAKSEIVESILVRAHRATD